MNRFFATALFLATGVGGYLFGSWHNGPPPNSNPKQQELAIRAQQYQPSCRALNNTPALEVKGADLFIIQATGNYYYTVALTFPKEGAPLFYWWGAGLDNALKSCRSAAE